MIVPGASCRLRPYTLDDVRVLSLTANDREVSRWMTQRFPYPYTVADAREWLSAIVRDDPPVNWAIDYKDAFVGGIGIVPQAGESAGVAELGFWLARRAWGRGIATRAVELVCAHAFGERELRRLEANVFAPNVASARVLEKAGFTREGVRTAAFVDRDGEVCDGVLYACLATA